MDLRHEYQTAQNKIDSKLATLKKMRETCERQKRLPNDRERETAEKILAEIDTLEARQKEIMANGGNDSDPPDKPAPGEPGETRDLNHGYQKRNHNQDKKFSSLFGKGRNDYRWKDKESHFIQALCSGRYHPELTKRAMTEGTPSSGGFLVPVEYSKDIFNVALENMEILPRCQVIPMAHHELRLPAMEIGDHSSNLFGGFTASWTAEAGTISDANPKVRSMALTANKLTGLIRASNELISDMNGPDSLAEIIGKGMGWYVEDSLINGSGVGRPQGFLNAACKIEVAKETGQTADTIVLENLNKMLARLYQGGFKNAVWVVSQTALPQLLQLSLTVGTGGSASLVMTEANGVYKIYGKKVIFSEHMEEVGTAGDIALVDLSQMVVGQNEELRLDISEHTYFTTDELAMRLIARLDAQCLWNESLTMKGSGTTVGPIITLAARD